MKEDTDTKDIDLVAYLLLKGFKVLSTKQKEELNLSGNKTSRTYFYFEPEVAEIKNQWLFSPDAEMKLLQDFLAKKDSLLEYVSPKQRWTP